MQGLKILFSKGRCAMIKQLKIFTITILITFFYLNLPLLSSAQASELSLNDVIRKVNSQLSLTTIIDQVNRQLSRSYTKNRSVLRVAYTRNPKLLSNSNELVFILAGQSNMAGFGTTAKLPASYRRTPSNVEFYFNGYPAKMSRFARFGPEISFAHAISRHFPHKKIKLIKFAVGGTSLFAWDPSWRLSKARLTRNASAGPLFKKLLQTIRTHTTGTHLSAILWMQGETDARYPGAARSYMKNLSHFVRALRRELKAPSLAFYIGEVDPPATSFPYRDIVRKAQRRSSAYIKNTLLVSTKGLAKRGDHLHYNTEGQIALGLRFAQAYIQTHRYHH